MNGMILFVSFLKTGSLSFGGGMAMLPFIYRQLVTGGFISNEEFGRMVVVSQITPGPIAVNAATYVGGNAMGVQGALIATFAVVFPSFVIMLTVLSLLQKGKKSRTMHKVTEGMRPVAVGLIAVSLVFILKGIEIPAYDDYNLLLSAIIFIAVFYISARWKKNPVLLILSCGIFGMILSMAAV